MRYLSSLSSEPRTSSRPIRRPAGRPIPALARSPPTLAPRFYPKQPTCGWRVLTAATVSSEAAQASPDPASRLLVGTMPLTLHTPAGSVEDPVPPGTARHTVPVSCREGRCAVCLHCAAGTRGQVSWCSHRTPWHRPPGQACGAAQVSRAPARGCVKTPNSPIAFPLRPPEPGEHTRIAPTSCFPQCHSWGWRPTGPSFHTDRRVARRHGAPQHVGMDPCAGLHDAIRRPGEEWRGPLEA
jgi:hypothetical protein